MTLDHVNKYLLSDAIYAFFAAGRLAMPLFAFILAFNLARPNAMLRGVRFRVLKRLSIAGAISSVPFIGLGGLAWGWWPLNIMVMLAITVGMMQLVEQGGKTRFALAVLVFLIGGAFVEFWWAGISIGLAAWSYCKRPNWLALLVWIAGLAALFIINRNWWALATLPLVFAAPHISLPMPRMQWFFYAFYPAHLSALWLLQSWMPTLRP